MNFEYSNQVFANKILKGFKFSFLMYRIIIIFLLLNYILLVINSELKWEATITFSIIVLAIFFILMTIYSKHAKRIMLETIENNLNPNAFIDLNIYVYIKRIFISKRVYNYGINNIIYAYINMGEFEKANELLDYLESQNLDNILTFSVTHKRMQIAFYKHNYEEVKKYIESLKVLLKNIPERQRIRLEVDMNLKEALIENNASQLLANTEQLEKLNKPLYKVMAEYYKGLFYENNNNEEYKKHYEFVAQNGNDLYLAQKAREKVNVKSVFKEKKIKSKGIKILFSIILIILLVIFLFLISYEYEERQISWDTGFVKINGIDIKLPYLRSDFEAESGLDIPLTNLNPLAIPDVYIEDRNRYQSNMITYPINKNVSLKIENGYITGIYIETLNFWNDVLDEEAGETIVFPQNITINNSIHEIQAKYNTGVFNFFMRDWDEMTKEEDYSYEFKYIGKEYSMEIETVNGKVTSMYYFCNE